jgi:hypothetical protein
VIDPFGFVSFTVIFCHLSPYAPPAVGGGCWSQKARVTCWPTPTGLGAALMKAISGTLSGGVCALAFGKSAIEAVIESMKITQIAVANNLFLKICILFFS